MMWRTDQPPKEQHIIAKLEPQDCVVSMRYRFGMLGEPSQGEKVWRCDCCGRFGGRISAWAMLETEG